MDLVARNRFALVEDVYHFGSGLTVKDVSGNIGDFEDKIRNYFVANKCTVFIDMRDGVEDVSWIDIDGLDYGWLFMNYTDDSGGTDYKAVEHELREYLLSSIQHANSCRKVSCYQVTVSDDDCVYGVFIDTRKLDGYHERYCTVYKLTKTLEETLESDC